MQISDELQRKVSQTLGLGDKLIEEWTPSDTAIYYNTKDGVLLEGLGQANGFVKRAMLVGIPPEEFKVVETGLELKVLGRLSIFEQEGTPIPWGNNSIRYKDETAAVRRELQK